MFENLMFSLQMALAAARIMLRKNLKMFCAVSSEGF